MADKEKSDDEFVDSLVGIRLKQFERARAMLERPEVVALRQYIEQHSPPGEAEYLHVVRLIKKSLTTGPVDRMKALYDDNGLEILNNEMDLSSAMGRVAARWLTGAVNFYAERDPLKALRIACVRSEVHGTDYLRDDFFSDNTDVPSIEVTANDILAIVDKNRSLPKEEIKNALDAVLNIYSITLEEPPAYCNAALKLMSEILSPEMAGAYQASRGKFVRLFSNLRKPGLDKS